MDADTDVPRASGTRSAEVPESPEPQARTTSEKSQARKLVRDTHPELLKRQQDSFVDHERTVERPDENTGDPS